MKTFMYRPKGVCSSLMKFEMEGETILHVEIVGGCSGNAKGICNILKNKTIDEVVAAFDGVKCGNKTTSCPEQIATALKEYRSTNA